MKTDRDRAKPSPAYVVAVPIEVGKKPAMITSACEACSAGLAAWLRLNGLRAYWAEGATPPSATSFEGADYAGAVLAAFVDWRAAAGHSHPAHLSVLEAIE